MTDDPILDGTIVEEQATEVERRLPVPVVPVIPVAQLSVTPDVPAGDLVKRLDVIREAMSTAMVADVDYGHIPGTSGKPSLFKPGAEKLSVLFQLDCQTTYSERLGPGDHYTVNAETVVYHQPTGTRLGNGLGLCTTKERKYGKRTAKRVCPNCGAEQINKSKFPPRDRPSAEPGWYCHAKFGGCGAQFDAADPAITGQALGDVENPDLADYWNTVLKMAKKRALVDAVLLATGASALFTQDLEDGQPDNDDKPPPTTPPTTPPPEPEPTATSADVGAMKAAAGGLTGQQIKLAIGACGLAIPNPPPNGPDGLFSWVPQSKALELTEKLAGIKRPEVSA